jgi:hypothetical protein
MPTGHAVGQAVLHHQADRGAEHAAGVVAAGIGQILHRGIEVAAAVAAVMLGVAQMQFAGPAPPRIAQVVQLPTGGPQAIGALAAAGTAAVAVVAALVQDQRRRQLLRRA